MIALLILAAQPQCTAEQRIKDTSLPTACGGELGEPGVSWSAQLKRQWARDWMLSSDGTENSAHIDCGERDIRLECRGRMMSWGSKCHDVCGRTERCTKTLDRSKHR